MQQLNDKMPVLITGDCKIMPTIALCLLLADQPVVILAEDVVQTKAVIGIHLKDVQRAWNKVPNYRDLSVVEKITEGTGFAMAIAVTKEDIASKLGTIARIEKCLSPDCIIAINTESIELGRIQRGHQSPHRIIGANWVYPAHTTYFLEVISNGNTDPALVAQFMDLARNDWNKDPYQVNGGQGIRARLMCAMIREALYLVENGYVNFEDIDRACRNDAGYYLPFAGNFRYMDLMGTYIYGLVMKEMNPDLSREQVPPKFFKELVKGGASGMENRVGFYEYDEDGVKRWESLARCFSYQIREIIDKYVQSSLK